MSLLESENGSEELIELKKIIRDSIEEYVSPIKNELSELTSSINRDLKLNYLNSIGRLLEREALEAVETFNCTYHHTTGNACKNMLKEQFSKYAQAVAMGDMANALSILNEFEKQAQENSIDSDKSDHCNSDWKNVLRIIKRHKDIAKDVSALFTAREVPSDIAELDFQPEELYEEVIFPFSHPIRIQIIHALKSGSKRFTALKNELGVKNTGLLVHHLKPLTEANIVLQDHRKQYSLSDKGFTVARYFSQLSNLLHPEEPETISIQPLVVLRNDE